MDWKQEKEERSDGLGLLGTAGIYSYLFISIYIYISQVIPAETEYLILFCIV